ncbi:Thiamine biosynthesis lipoprotein ApbE precursor [Symmachiella macrocystis]|uniref:FAD:protein FMN transferase n=1 Tax=Symmachiella macrocystis TaxID=2527985 RepID=A0A5C6BI72_9PLAN|nr:FAD:protein FMN transferase [Symmachiella macrocystis]TWU11412.1 Thiamine biosynthesis lipoprotein ApbE precursor [Symmachiella macrocystis]
MTLLCVLLLSANPNAPETWHRYEFQRIRMGIPVKISLYATDDDTAKHAAQAAFARFKQLDRILSDYDPDSELMQLCARAGSDRDIPVSQDLKVVLEHSLRVSRKTDGAFDVTVGPLVKLWRKARRKRQLPTAEALTEARAAVGYESVVLDAQSSKVRLIKPNMRLDLGGIAKGYTADQALGEMKKHGVSRALIDAGGDIVVGDPPPGKDGWRIGMAPLQKRDGPPSRFVTLKNAGIATSGDAWQFVEIDGQRYSHIIDRQTGYGLTERSSVTVIAADGITSDALASAVSVLGVERGLALIEKTCGTSALIVTLEEDQPVVHASKAFPADE